MGRITAEAKRLEELREANDPGFAAAVGRFYAPFEELKGRLRGGEIGAVEPALEFLEADPWCFRSGYVKADLMHALANGPSLESVRDRVQAIVLNRVEHHEPRLLRYAARLAATVWDDGLEAAVEAISRDGDARESADAQELLDRVRGRTRTTQRGS
jgi:hypothetical protein